jgi:hypothetical protein
MAVQTFHLINNDAGAQTVKTRAGDVFALAAYIYPKTGNTGGGTIKLNLHCTNSTGSPAATDVVVFTETVPATGSWTYIQGNATVPANYDTVDPEITLTGVPVTDTIYIDDVLVRETTAAQNAIDTIWQNITGSGTINNSLATLGASVANWINKLFGTTSVQNTVQSGAVPSLDASKITTGTFAQTFITGLTTLWNGWFGTTTPTGSTPLLSTTVPSLDASKITTGTFAQTFITGLTSLWTSWFGTASPTGASVLNANNVASLDASKITTGTFAQSFITGLQTLWNGWFGTTTPTGSTPLLATTVPSLDASKVTTGTFAQSFISGLTTLWNGWFGTTTPTGSTPLLATTIPGLDASKITTGQIGSGTLPTIIPSLNIPALLGLTTAANMVLDPDFEATTLWTGATGAQTTLQAHSGTHSWALTGAG